MSLPEENYVRAEDIRDALGREPARGPGLRAAVSHLADLLSREGWGPATLALDDLDELPVSGGGGTRVTGDPLTFVLVSTGRADPALLGLDETVNVYRSPTVPTRGVASRVTKADVDPDETRRLHDAMPFAGVLGVQPLSLSAEEVRARLDWDATRCTSADAMHGGALMGLADVVGGLCAFLNLPEGATGTTTIESKTNFLRAVRQGHVDAVARPLHVGRTVIVIETDLYDADDRRVTKVIQSQAVLR